MHIRTELISHKLVHLTLEPHELVALMTALAHLGVCAEKERPEVSAVADAMYTGLHQKFGIDLEVA